MDQLISFIFSQEVLNMHLHTDRSGKTREEKFAIDKNVLMNVRIKCYHSNYEKRRITIYIHDNSEGDSDYISTIVKELQKFTVFKHNDISVENNKITTEYNVRNTSQAEEYVCDIQVKNVPVYKNVDSPEPVSRPNTEDVSGLDETKYTTKIHPVSSVETVCLFKRKNEWSRINTEKYEEKLSKVGEISYSSSNGIVVKGDKKEQVKQIVYQDGAFDDVFCDVYRRLN